ncbi:hypothetical protein [Haloarcula sp. 1CSR25-25]|nr:hypothetical protein [Haloarcula sp. 1CSR25-25]
MREDLNEEFGSLTIDPKLTVDIESHETDQDSTQRRSEFDD